MSTFTRRTCLGMAALAVSNRLVAAQSDQATSIPSTRPDSEAGTVRDRLWMWAHPAGSYNTARNKDEWPFTDYGFTKTSRMTPAEGARYLGLPNVIFLRYVGKPLPTEFEQVAQTLQPFKRIIWSINITAARDSQAQFGWNSNDEEEHQVLRDLLEKYPNIIGLIMDDYFKSTGEKRDAIGPDQVREFKKSFGRAEFWDAIYTSDIENTSKEHLDVVDATTLWTRAANDLADLEANFEKMCRLHPRARKVLGCYMWDFLGGKRPIPIPLMKHQCELGLKWLKEGRIEGISFIASPMCDMDIEAVEWTRQWIQQVGDQRL